MVGTQVRESPALQRNAISDLSRFWNGQSLIQRLEGLVRHEGVGEKANKDLLLMLTKPEERQSYLGKWVELAANSRLKVYRKSRISNEGDLEPVLDPFAFQSVPYERRLTSTFSGMDDAWEGRPTAIFVGNSLSLDSLEQVKHDASAQIMPNPYFEKYKR